jgi:hypothetical protein
MIEVLSIISPIAHSIQKICGNCHVTNVIISSMGGVHCNTCCSKSMVQKLGFLHGFIVTNDETMLLTIDDKWF